MQAAAPRAGGRPVKRLDALRDWARRLKRDVVAVWFAARDPRTPLAVRLFALALAAYALSPIDLIPDFIPVLGYLDELLIVPLGIALAVRWLPPEVLADARERASTVLAKPRSRWAAAFIVLVWAACAALAARWWLAR